MSVPEQITATLDHHGMDARFRARAPREARILAVAIGTGMLLPLLPVIGLMAVGVYWPAYIEKIFGPLMFGIVATLIAQCTLGPMLLAWAGKPAEVHLHIDDKTLKWEQEGDRTAFRLEDIRHIEAMSGEILVEDASSGHRLPCSGLKGPAIAWLEERMREAWSRRKDQMQDTVLDRAERRKLGKLTS